MKTKSDLSRRQFRDPGQRGMSVRLKHLNTGNSNAPKFVSAISVVKSLSSTEEATCKSHGIY